VTVPAAIDRSIGVSPMVAVRRDVDRYSDQISPSGAFFDLVQLIGSKGAASELLSGKRKEPSKSQIAKLCARFKVDASAFLLPRSASADAA
jgi:antitoxin component HigA of HigAB toxin-antitoxin module